ncbi:YugN family protein [Virgibacillus xinjiangensis]|uniref:YugN family protein n=1 Tax=Virgibacillus xinjiangensis TaxID=393090 RepID=A0ABV7CZ88_9BACI
MLKLETEMEGKKAYFGDVRKIFKRNGYTLCGSWEYDGGFFDGVLSREAGETIYIRIPFHVLEGELDRDEAYLEFGTPFVIKHVVHLGLDKDEQSLLAATGLNQFQEPLDKDGQIKDKSKWEMEGEQAIGAILDYIS